jgi:hypothetical protein
MEVLLGRGTEIGGEARQNPSLVPNPDDPMGPMVRATRVHSDWDYYLLRGFQMAPTAPHDNHMANWGTGHSSRTALFVDGGAPLTEAALLEAIEERAVYASEDENLVVRFYAAGRVPMGGRLRTIADQVTLELSLTDPDYAGPYTVTVYRGTVGGASVEPVARLEGNDASGWRALDVDAPGPGLHFFYLEVAEPDVDRMAWSAPIWVERL